MIGGMAFQTYAIPGMMTPAILLRSTGTMKGDDDMGLPVIVYGKSGSGKSRSLRGFAEDEIFLVNVVGKELPFKGRFKYMARISNVDKIIEGLQNMPTNVAVIDDAGYIMTSMFMDGHSAPKKGASSFDLFNDIGDGVWKLMRFVSTSLPRNKIVYFNFHEITTEVGECKIRTIGKLLDEKVCLEGLVTVALHCMTNGERHFFCTQSNGFDIAKSPEEMFMDKEIPNDLKLVDSTIRAYYDMEE